MESLHLLQARYWDSPASFESAKLIVERKCWNMSHLLLRAMAYRRSRYPEQAHALNRDIYAIQKASSACITAIDRTRLLLAEGRASKAYWNGFHLLVRSPQNWCRDYPHATDPWNQALNVGYTVLTNVIRERVIAHGLTPAIGMLHAPRQAHEALVYDFEELFRQPAVDGPIATMFSRKKMEDISSKTVIAVVLGKLETVVVYQGKRWHLRTALEREIIQFASALERKVVYEPYRHSWAHGG